MIDYYEFICPVSVGLFDSLSMQLHSFLKNIHFNNGAGQEIFFEKRHLSAGYDIINHIHSVSASGLIEPIVGNFFPSEEFIIKRGFYYME